MSHSNSENQRYKTPKTSKPNKLANILFNSVSKTILLFLSIIFSALAVVFLVIIFILRLPLSFGNSVYLLLYVERYHIHILCPILAVATSGMTILCLRSLQVQRSKGLTQAIFLISIAVLVLSTFLHWNYLARQKLATILFSPHSEMVFEAKQTRLNDLPINDQTIKQAILIVLRRLDPLASGSVTAEPTDKNRILVRIDRRLSSETRKIPELLTKRGIIEFRILPRSKQDQEEFDRYVDTVLANDPEVSSSMDSEYVWCRLSDKISNDVIRHAEMVVKDREDIKYVLAHRGNDHAMEWKPNKWRITQAKVSKDHLGRRCIQFEFDKSGGELFWRLTKSHVDMPLAIVIDNAVYSAPHIQSAIRSEGIITGNFTFSEAYNLAQILNSQPLPFGLTLVSTDAK